MKSKVSQFLKLDRKNSKPASPNSSDRAFEKPICQTIFFQRMRTAKTDYIQK
eukprot:Pgem_evm1s15508